jgi:hypothetical protein
VSIVIEEGWGCIRFRMNLWGETTKMWQGLKDLCTNVNLNSDSNICIRLSEKSGQFLVKSIYSNED